MDFATSALVYTVLIVAGIFLSAFPIFLVVLLVKRVRVVNLLPPSSVNARIIGKKMEERRECIGDSFVYKTYYILIFQTDDNVQWNFDVPSELYNVVIEGDYGTVFYKQSQQKQLYFVNFLRKKDEMYKIVTPKTVIDMTCTNCGAAMDADMIDGVATCAFCGSKVVVPFAYQHIKQESVKALANTQEAFVEKDEQATNGWQIKYKVDSDRKVGYEIDMTKGEKKHQTLIKAIIIGTFIILFFLPFFSFIFSIIRSMF